MDMTHICRNCCTDEREGQHRQATLSPDGNSVTFSCTVPCHSDLPRAIAFVDFGDTTPEYWYRKEVADETRRVNEKPNRVRMSGPSALTRVGEYRGFGIYDEPNGWYAENDGGTCLGPFDHRADAERAVDKALA